MGVSALAVSKNGSDEKPAPPRNPKSARKAGNKEVGQALRSAYDQTVNEDVPSDLLDLLGKLS
ncbi:NepR family anti-sigma factor [Sphingomonas sp. ID0503]|uniref:NepR family anti-sigma factor n=1 Tax=Sphingomonas sp. ID0503 TaxID=3399691 RepID=UPI003AFB7746